MSDNGQDLEARLSVIMEDKFSIPMKTLNSELQKTLSVLSEVGKKLGDLENINLERLTREMKNVKDAAISINTPTHKVDVATNSGIAQKNIDSLVKAEAQAQQVQNALGRKQVEHYEDELELKIKKAETRAKEIEQRLDKAAREANLAADTANKNASAILKEAKAKALENSGQMQYTAGAAGGLASILGAENSRMRNKRGSIGLLNRFGTRLAENPNSRFGRAFGKGGGVNNLFGGLLKKGTIDGMGINAGGLALGGFATAIGVATTAIGKFSSESLKAYGQMQRLSTSMNVVYGSKTQSDEAFSKIQNYSIRSPFGIEQTTEMAILLKQSGIYASDLQETLEMIGDVSSGNEEKMKRIANNYAQIQAIGHANMLDMRQFAYAGLPIYEEVAKTMKVSQSELRSMIQEGKVSAEVMEKTFKRMTSEGGTFYKAVNKGAKTLAARQTNLNDIKNIEKSYFGQYLWNFGGDLTSASIGQRIMGLREDWHKGWSNWHRGSTIRQQNRVSNNADAFYSSLVRAYEKALETHNEPLLKEISAKMDKFKSSLYGEDEIRAGFTARAKQKMGLLDKNIVSDALYNETYNELVSVIAEAYKNSSFFDEEKYTDPEAYAKAYARNALQMGTIGNSFNNASEKAYAKELFKSLKSMISESQVQEKLEALSNTAGKAYLALAYMKTGIEETSNTFVDFINKNAGRADSLSSRHTNYMEAWKQSPAGKAKQAEEDRKAYAAYSRDFDRAKKMVDTENNTLIPNAIKSVEDLSFVMKSGFITNASKIDVISNSIARRPDDWKKVISNLENTLPILKNIGFDEKSKLYKTVEKFYNKYKDSPASKETGKNFSTDYYKGILNKSGLFDDSEAGELAKLLMESISTTFDSSNLQHKADYTDIRGNGDMFISLWRRILAQSTGVSANVINNAKDALGLYKNEVAPRNTASDIFSKMLKNGYGLRSMSSLLAYTGENKELRGDAGFFTKQINWKEVNKNLETFASKLRTTSTYISSFRSSLEEQYETLLDLAVSGVTTSETQDIKEQKSVTTTQLDKMVKDSGEQFVNAFSAHLKTASGKEVAYFKDGFAYDKENNKLEEKELYYAEGMYRFLEEELLKLFDKIGTVRTKELQSSVLENGANQVKSTIIQNALLTASVKSPMYSNVISGNENTATEYVNKQLPHILKETLPIFKNKEVTDEDINKAILDNDLTTEDISNAIVIALKDAVSSDTFRNIVNQEASLEEQNQGLNFINTVMGFKEARDGSRSSSSALEQMIYNSLGLNDVDLSKVDYDSLNVNRRASRDDIDSMFRSIFEMHKTGLDEKQLSSLKSYGATEEQLETLSDINAPYQKRLEILEEIRELNEDITEDSVKQRVAQEGIANALTEFGKSVEQTTVAAGKEAFVAPFEAVGEALVKGSFSAESLAQNLNQIAAGMMKQVGIAMTTCGFQIAGNAATIQNWGLVAAGLGMAAAGGVASGMGSALSSLGDSDSSGNSYEKEAEDKISKLTDLRNSLLDLLKQAREDSVYYEKNLTHKKAIAFNSSMGKDVKVNDAIITPSGNVISTHPDDYLIATKTPQSLVSGNASPKVNFKFIDKSTGVKIVSQKETYNERDNTLDLSVIIDNKISEFISTSKGDDAFNARAVRNNGIRYTG